MFKTHKQRWIAGMPTCLMAGWNSAAALPHVEDIENGTPDDFVVNNGDWAVDCATGDFALTLSLSDGVTTDMILLIDSTPSLNTHPGIRNRDAGLAESVIGYDNFQVVPETASLAMARRGLAVASTGWRRD